MDRGGIFVVYYLNNICRKLSIYGTSWVVVVVSGCDELSGADVTAEVVVVCDF